ncbi:MAG: pyruvate, phosphate dikinase [Hyphomicrobiaceae bacterium]|nr:pyruvate, phosphate dikinase [Hyphomicrobiaceae bacterium]
MAGSKLVYLFGPEMTDGDAGLVELLGGKGANLAEMAQLGLPVPPGFTITTEVCNAYYKGGRKLPEELRGEVEAALDRIGVAAGRKFGDPGNPLLVSVRSGSRASMPGMMDTILDLGLNDETVAGLVRHAGDERFAYDSYRRFIQMYSDVVLGVDHGLFEDILENFKNLNGLQLDTDLEAEHWKKIVVLFKDAVAKELDQPFPQDTADQLWGAIGAVFGSWENTRAKTYRRLHSISDDWGTAVSVQAMVFGNMGETSATGVAFTRDPSTGEHQLYGEYLINAQGEDVVAGIRTPQPLTAVAVQAVGRDYVSLEEVMPEAFVQLVAVCERLERHYRDMQDIEFTIERGQLWMLQTRSGKRTVEAALRIAVEMANEGIITKEEAILRIDPAGLDHLLHPTIDPAAEKELLTTGLPASPGAASGEIVFTADAAVDAKAQGRDVILVRLETSPEDIHGMHAAVGILTARGGMTSHAAVVARGMGRPCVAGAGALRIDLVAKTLTVGRVTLKSGDVVTIDGGTGEVLKGRVQMRRPELSGAFGTLMSWADTHRRLGVRANADTPRDAEQACHFGAEGIGLCRTEHMFFEADRIIAVRKMILASDEGGRREALSSLLPMQRADFVRLFEIMAGMPVTIRLLDPPLHEFLPHQPHEQEAVAADLGIDVARIRRRVIELSEVNPMLGFRGCRIGILYPEIVEMQARAIFEAALAAEQASGQPVVVEIMLPLVIDRAEFDLVAEVIRETAAAVSSEQDKTFDYQIGTMVELPRSVLRAGDIASGETGAAFFSFGTNDLTQTTMGLSRDDAAPILNSYTAHGIFLADPFVTIDEDGVGELMKIGVERGRKVKPDLKIGICGEHGGDPASVAFCHDAGFTYVSCSPFRVPIARLAAAQAALRSSRG